MIEKSYSRVTADERNGETNHVHSETHRERPPNSQNGNGRQRLQDLRYLRIGTPVDDSGLGTPLRRVSVNRHRRMLDRVAQDQIPAIHCSRTEHNVLAATRKQGNTKAKCMKK